MAMDEARSFGMELANMLSGHLQQQQGEAPIGGRITVSYDTATDRLTIRKTVHTITSLRLHN